jgi:hypothetical protein
MMATTMRQLCDRLSCKRQILEAALEERSGKLPRRAVDGLGIPGWLIGGDNGAIGIPSIIQQIAIDA